jgi:single-stranded DNA-binding protein
MAEGLGQEPPIGSLEEDFALRYTQSNQGVLSVRMATTESCVSAIHRCARATSKLAGRLGKRSEALSELLSKASQPRLPRRSAADPQDQQGNKRLATEVVASNVVLLGGGSRREDHHDQGAVGHSGRDNSYGAHDGVPGTTPSNLSCARAWRRLDASRPGRHLVYLGRAARVLARAGACGRGSALSPATP